MLPPEHTKEFLHRMQIITRNVTGIVHGDKDKDLDWQIGQMITTCENWSDRLDQAKANQTGNH